MASTRRATSSISASAPPKTRTTARKPSAASLQYAAHARATYAQAQERAAAAERAREERRRAQDAEQRQRQYDAYRAARLAQLRATTPPAVLAAIEEATAAQFERDNSSRFGRALLRQYAMDDAVAAYFQLPSFAEWQAAQGQD